jgi:hypothetical protein
MPYMPADAVAARRTAIRAAFPRKDGWDVSVTRDGHSGVLATFKGGPIPLTAANGGYEQVNPYYIDKNAVSPDAAAVLNRVVTIINADNGTLYESSDYGSIPKFYIGIHVGAWNAPYIVRQ